MPQLPAGALAEEPAAGELKPGPVKASAPMLVRIAVADLGRDLVQNAVQRHGSPKKAFDSLAVPIALKGVQRLKKEPARIPVLQETAL